jgi:hypothetical protein
MGINKAKWVTLAVSVCFAILQTLQPFIHAHLLDVDHPTQHTGFHLGDDHEASVSFSDHQADHAATNTVHASNTVSVASGIKQDVNSALLVEALSTALLYFCFIIVALSTLKRYPSSNLTATYRQLRRRLPAPRAPPQF